MLCMAPFTMQQDLNVSEGYRAINYLFAIISYQMFVL